ncbi:MAG: hypothetical protein JJU37_17010 [Balneolaceae bacterium]|nr:hypothetical protein [Balneolaceae bacterium]
MERIWVDPREITHMISREEVYRLTGIHRNRASGVVINWNDVAEITPITEDFRIEYCFKHWQEGKSWEEIGVFDFMSNTKAYGNWPEEKIKARFSMLDKAFEETKNSRRLKTRSEMNPSNFREQDGILVHIAKNGKPVFGGNGFHRLAIAKVLKLEKIPACIGLVDKDSISYLKQYRNPE